MMIATIEPIPAFSDNYLWLIHDGRKAVVVDPGDGNAVIAALEARGLELTQILVTHHHPDHVGGIPSLLSKWDVPVYGPAAEAVQIGTLTRLLKDGDRVRLPILDVEFTVIAVPGHTLGHIAYHGRLPTSAGKPREVLFCGDTLFAAGCGRLFEGSPQQMHDSLDKLAALPKDTEVYCAHEYTASNLAFAQAVEPDDMDIENEAARVRALRADGRPSVPSSIGRERRFNPFLRCTNSAIAASVSTHVGRSMTDAVDVFAELRRWKDGFRAPAA